MSKGIHNNCAVMKEKHAGGQKKDFRESPRVVSQIKNVIGVFSGKGGVGKSLVTSMLAVMMRRERFQTAILDADVTGPSIPGAFGMLQKPEISDMGIFPIRTGIGISVMSLNLMLKQNTDPVIWRGSIIPKAVKQFWADVTWGNVDFLFVDMPPGTGDVPRAIFQSLPLDGVIIVASPQALSDTIVESAISMAGKMNVPVLALVENMSYIICEGCGGIHPIFGESHIDKIAENHGIDTVCRLPVNPDLAAAVDAGTIELFEGDELNGIIAKLLKIARVRNEFR